MKIKKLFFFTVTMFSVLFLVYSCSETEPVNKKTDIDSEKLGYLIKSMDSADVITFSGSSYDYVLSSLKERSWILGSEDVIPFASRLYRVRDIENGYILKPCDGRVKSDYKLIITLKSYQISPAGFLDFLILKKS